MRWVMPHFLSSPTILPAVNGALSVVNIYLLSWY
jgi:hypothetical protein